MKTHFPVFGQLAVEGQRERQRNVEAAKAQSLPGLDFLTIEKLIVTKESKKGKKLTGREALLAMRAKREAREKANV